MLEPITITRDTLYNGNRTRVTAVKGRCLNRLTTEPDIVTQQKICYHNRGHLARENPRGGLSGKTVNGNDMNCAGKWKRKADEDFWYMALVANRFTSGPSIPVLSY